MMTRRGLALQEESKLKLALTELQSCRDLCTQLTSEREENEKELLSVLEGNRKLKNEMSLLFQENNSLKDQCVMLQQELNKLDSYGNEYEVALLRIRSLEKQLLEAQQYINNLEAVSQSVKDTHTNILYNTLIHDSGSTPTHNVKSLGKNKIRKYIKINKYIKKTQKLKTQYRNVNSVDLKVQNTQLQNELDLHLIETENAKLKYESDTLDLKTEILKLQELTNSLTSKFEESQCMVEKYSSAMEDLLQISNYTAECYEQLQNKTYGCNYKSLQLPQTSQHTHSLTYTTTNTQLKEKIKAKERNLMYSDEMGVFRPGYTPLMKECSRTNFLGVGQGRNDTRERGKIGTFSKLDRAL
ncbi:unnamed protein product [Pieris macdunnoughi]|uniref:Uncharacterized protein n=1 Tax=Pieris macdunnoughi TaxID=345717 RepID=A0A821LGT0_9NEOP|nr:unnamed protein product [Pieris macdunnoughi]